MKPLKWGVVSTANIGLEKVLPAMAGSPDCEIVAIASRDRARAESAARELGIPKAPGDLPRWCWMVVAQAAIG